MGILDFLGSSGDDRAYARAEAAARERQKAAAGRYLVGLDLGQRNDWTALACLESSDKDDLLTLRRLERVRGRPYPEIARMVSAVMAALPPESTLLVDVTGVGRAVC